MKMATKYFSGSVAHPTGSIKKYDDFNLLVGTVDGKYRESDFLPVTSGAIMTTTPAYRTKEFDYTTRRVSKTARNCGLCQRDIRPESPTRTVHLIDGGANILHPADEHLYTPDAGDCGSQIVGMDCAKTIGMEWTTE